MMRPTPLLRLHPLLQTATEFSVVDPSNSTLDHTGSSTWLKMASFGQHSVVCLVLPDVRRTRCWVSHNTETAVDLSVWGCSVTHLSFIHFRYYIVTSAVAGLPVWSHPYHGKCGGRRNFDLLGRGLGCGHATAGGSGDEDTNLIVNQREEEPEDWQPVNREMYNHGDVTEQASSWTT